MGTNARGRNFFATSHARIKGINISDGSSYSCANEWSRHLDLGKSVGDCCDSGDSYGGRDAGTDNTSSCDIVDNGGSTGARGGAWQ